MQIIPDPIFSAVMVIPFAVTVALLYVILVDPVRRFLEGRDAAIRGAREHAKHLAAQAESQLSGLEQRLGEARTAAGAIRAEHRERGLAAERAIVEEARKAAAGQVGAALVEIEGERQAARASIEGTARAISVDIAGRVLGRGVQA